ncbi:MAG: TraB/GumN family protein [Verrucomicrobia bacterium]|nr:TraB/GumN family protein [Verrucomicrobiota bacterium]
MTRLNLILTNGVVAIYLFLSSAVFPCSLRAADNTHANTAPRVSSPAPSRPASGPFLWKIEGQRPSWLFGTIHSADPAVATLPASVTAALDGCRTFHPEVELSADLAPLLAAKLFASEAPDLSTRLPPALWVRVQRAAATLGLPDMMLQRLTPGIATLLFSAPVDTDVDATVDGQLHTRATQKNLKIVALETLDEQLGIFEKLPEAQAIVALKEALDEAEAGRPNEKRLLRAYASGDERALIAAIDAEFSSSPGARALADPLLYRRNARMADRLKPHLAAGGAFVAIGAAHLLGPKSVIELLRARGLKVTRVL